MNKSFLFATFSRKTKSQVVESRITLLVWSCLSLVEKQRTINHMIFFNDSISKFYQCGAFAEAYLYFLATKKKKNAEAMKFLGILKKYISNKKIYFCLKKETFLAKKKKNMLRQ